MQLINQMYIGLPWVHFQALFLSDWHVGTNILTTRSFSPPPPSQTPILRVRRLAARLDQNCSGYSSCQVQRILCCIIAWQQWRRWRRDAAICQHRTWGRSPKYSRFRAILDYNFTGTKYIWQFACAHCTQGCRTSWQACAIPQHRSWAS
jgi:hypothetical protein